MIRRSVWSLSFALLALPAAASAEKRVTVCHLPAGNPGNPQTISVGEAAVHAHLAHGDELGPCVAGCTSGCDDGNLCTSCLLYTSDAADERSSVDLGGR